MSRLGADAFSCWHVIQVGFIRKLEIIEEVVITKYTYDGFVDTHLNSVLRKSGIKTLVLAGADSDVCVRDTAAHGFALGYTPVFAGDALAADNEVGHAGALQTLEEHYGKIVSTEEIVSVWRDGA